MNFILKRCFSSAIKSKTAFLTPLKQRGIVALIGIQSYDLLQGICTNDLKKFQADSQKVALATAFLDTQGRIIAEAILNKPQIYTKDKKVSSEDELWLDCDKSQIEILTKHIKKYIFRKKIEIEDLSDEIEIWNLFNPSFEVQDSNCGRLINFTEETISPEDEGVLGDFSYFDPRLKELGIRFVTPAEENRIDVDKNECQINDDQLFYEKMRMLLGIAEGQELTSVLPFTANLDMLNGVHFQKGCYVGQELTARSYHTGIVRKRIVPFVLSTPKVKDIDNTKPNLEYFDVNYTNHLKDKLLVNQDGKNIGKVIANINNVGLAIVSILKIEREKNYKMQIEGTDGCIIKTNWFSKGHSEYLEKVKSRDPELLNEE